jgi:hypothetical protein
MKNKISLIILALYVFSGSTDLVFATSGACSYHSGANCSASSYNGSVVCNDGWTDSSVKYYDMEECKIDHYCTTEEFRQILSKYQPTIDQQKASLAELNTQLVQKKVAYDAQFQMTGAQNIPSVFVSGQLALERSAANSEITSIAVQIQTAQDNLNSSLDIAKRECLTLGNSEYTQQQNQLMLEKINADKIAQEEALQEQRLLFLTQEQALKNQESETKQRLFEEVNNIVAEHKENISSYVVKEYLKPIIISTTSATSTMAATISPPLVSEEKQATISSQKNTERPFLVRIKNFFKSLFNRWF